MYQGASFHACSESPGPVWFPGFVANCQTGKNFNFFLEIPCRGKADTYNTRPRFGEPPGLSAVHAIVELLNRMDKDRCVGT